MKKNKPFSYVGIAFVILLFGVFVVRNYKHHLQPRNTRLNHVPISLPQESGLSYLTIGGQEKKIPNFNFTNQNNQPIGNVDFEGKVYVVEFFFTTCPSICPIMNKNMMLVEKEFGTHPNFGIASFTINPTVDTPIKLKAYAENYGVTSLNWHFLTGAQTDIYELANKGFNLFASENSNAPGGFEHSGFFALVDKKGYLRSRNDAYGNPIAFYDGTETKGVEMLIDDIALLLEKE